MKKRNKRRVWLAILFDKKSSIKITYRVPATNKNYRGEDDKDRPRWSPFFALTQNKISLSPFGDQIYFLQDGITSLAYGHNEIIQECIPCWFIQI